LSGQPATFAGGNTDLSLPRQPVLLAATPHHQAQTAERCAE